MTDRQINTYADTEPPKQQARSYAELLNVSSASSLFAAFGVNYAPQADLAGYFAQVGWISNASPRKLTPVGRAVVKAVAAHAEVTVEAAVVLSPDDPLNLGLLTREIAAAKDGLLVDPYFSDDLFDWLYSSTSLSRVLLCRKPENLTVLGLFLGGLEQAGERTLEVRHLPLRALHDRYVVGSDGAVSMIGASLNGLHRNFTALVRLPDPAAEAVRSRMEQEWARATKVVPQRFKNPPPASIDDLSEPANDNADDAEEVAGSDKATEPAQ